MGFGLICSHLVADGKCLLSGMWLTWHKAILLYFFQPQNKIFFVKNKCENGEHTHPSAFTLPHLERFFF